MSSIEINGNLSHFNLRTSKNKPVCKLVTISIFLVFFCKK